MRRIDRFLSFTKEEFLKLVGNSQECITCAKIKSHMMWQKGTDNEFCFLYISSLRGSEIEHLLELFILEREWSIS